MWGMSWANFLMDLATIPNIDTDTKSKSDEEVHISPEDEAAQLRKDLGL